MIVRVDMSNMKIYMEPYPKEYNLLGGRGFTSRYLADNVDPLSEPLGENNKLVIAPGLLGGTSAPCSGRISIGSISPLTGGIKESNAGGTAGTKLAKMGIKAIVVEGKPSSDEIYVLRLTTHEMELVSSGYLKGLRNYELTERLFKRYGRQNNIISIGPAGERGYSMSSIAVTDVEGLPVRHCGRGGLGAVLGSKKLKAIVIDDTETKRTEYSNEQDFKNIAKEWAKELISTKKTLTEFGTSNLVDLCNTLGILPVENFRTGRAIDAEMINSESLKEIIHKRGGKSGHACHPGCVIRCSNIYNDENRNYLTSSLEFETIALLGSNCGIYNLDYIARLDRFCDDFGIDTMELGVTMGVIMESGLIPFGNIEGALKLIEELENDTVLGKLIGQGAYVTGKVLGVKRIPTVKRQGMPAYDPRGLKGTGVTCATSPMGADHTAGNCLPGRKGYRSETTRDFNITKPEGQIELSRDIQIMSAVCDISGLCFFVGPSAPTVQKVVHLINAKYGTNLDFDDLIEIAKQTIKNEVEYNNQAGITKIENRLPEFFYTEELDTTGTVFDVNKNDLKNFYSI